MSGEVTDINMTSPDLSFPCITGNVKGRLTNQMFLKNLETFFRPGDSGAAVLDGAGSIIGMYNWIRDSAGSINGGGTQATTIREKLGFDEWLGTLTYPLTGSFDTITSLYGEPISAWGWARDPVNLENSIQVEIYVDGPKGFGTLAATLDANEPRADVDPNVNHGFRWEIPLQYLTGTHDFYIYAKEHSQSTFTTLLPGSPRVGPDFSDGFDLGNTSRWSNTVG